MNKREKRYTACISIMIILLTGLIMVACSGCTSYKVHQIRADGTETEVKVKSWRSFQNVALKYNREGDVVGFEFGAASAVSQTPIDAALRGVQMGLQIATGRPAASNEQE